jgi:hypothetical protein
MKYKRQHIVPNCYLSAWLEPNPPTGQERALWRIAKDGSEKHRRSPKKTFIASNRYTVLLKNGERDLRVEHRLSEIETAYSGVLRRLHRREKITVLDKAKLAIFTAAMLGRTRRRADHWKSTWENLRGQVVAYEGDDKDSQASGTLPSDEPLPPGAVRVSKQMLDDMLVNSHPEFLVNTVETSAPILFAMDMSLYSTDDELGFLTSDEPCIMQNWTAHRYHPMMRSVGLLQRHVQIFLPLSPRLLLVFSHTPTYPRITPLTREQTNDINRMIVHYALEEFVSWKGEVRDEWFASADPLPEDAYQEQAVGGEGEYEVLDQPELLDVSVFPAGHPFRRCMEG